MKVGDTVVCVVDYARWLTKDSTYTIEEVRECTVAVVDDDNDWYHYGMKHFKPLPQINKQRIPLP